MNLKSVCFNIYWLHHNYTHVYASLKDYSGIRIKLDSYSDTSDIQEFLSTNSIRYLGPKYMKNSMNTFLSKI